MSKPPSLGQGPARSSRMLLSPGKPRCWRQLPRQSALLCHHGKHHHLQVDHSLSTALSVKSVVKE